MGSGSITGSKDGLGRVKSIGLIFASPKTGEFNLLKGIYERLARVIIYPLPLPISWFESGLGFCRSLLFDFQDESGLNSVLSHSARWLCP